MSDSLRGSILSSAIFWNSWASLVAQLVKNLPAMKETRVRSLGREDPLEKGMACDGGTQEPCALGGHRRTPASKYLGFSYLGHGVSLQGCSSKVQPMLLTLDEGYLLTSILPDLQRGIAPLLKAGGEGDDRG